MLDTIVLIADVDSVDMIASMPIARMPRSPAV